MSKRAQAIIAEMERKRLEVDPKRAAQMERARKSLAACFEHDDYAAIECGKCGEFTPLSVAIIPGVKEGYKCRACGFAVELSTIGKYEWEPARDGGRGSVMVGRPVKVQQQLLC